MENRQPLWQQIAEWFADVVAQVVVDLLFEGLCALFRGVLYVAASLLDGL
jgi:hypothetical protein